MEERRMEKKMKKIADIAYNRIWVFVCVYLSTFKQKKKERKRWVACIYQLVERK